MAVTDGCRFLAVYVALQREAVSIVPFPVHPKSALHGTPIVEASSIGVIFRTARKAHAIHPKVKTFVVAAPVSGVEKGLLRRFRRPRTSASR